MRNVDFKLNFIPVIFSNQTFKGYEIPYVDEEDLKNLRSKYVTTHAFRRQGNIIQCVPLTESAEPLGQERTFKVDSDFGLARNLVQDALLRIFKDKKVQFTKLFSPMKFVRENDNLMGEVVGDDVASLLPMYPEYEIDSTVLMPHRKPPVFGILVKYFVKRLIEANVKDLMERKIDVQDLYITTAPEEGHAEGIVDKKYRRKLAGRIVGIKGSKLQLTDFSDKGEVESHSSYLEPSTTNFKHCLNCIAPREFEQLQEKIAVQIFKVKGAKNQYDRLRKLNEWLAQISPIHCSKDLSFTVAPQVYEPVHGSAVGEYKQLNMPEYVLRPGGSITVKGRVDELIEEKGPFDTESFPKKKVRIAVIFPRRYQGEVEVFIRQFKDGVVPKSSKKIPYTQGFIRKYRLTSCDFDFYPIEDSEDDSKGFKKVCLEALRNPKGYDIAIVVIREEFHKLHGEDNPYLVTKSTFMSQGAPVQEIEIETIRDDRGKPWILNNMALAVYAKLGGIPWVLTSTPGMTHELIFGIGSARIQTKRLSESERVVGITTVFNGDGNYLLYNVSKDVPYEEYQSTLLQSLKDCLEEIKARYGWQPGDNVRLIFHQSFKKYRDVEAQAVKKFVQSITDFNVEYAFVHISTTHQWNIFDTQSDGADYWENYKKFVKGKYVPMRGYCIPLGPQTALLTLTGPQQLKTHLQGCPDPILISIHRESTFTSQEYLISQIYKFTFMSWKSFFPSTMPVTIAYSDMIANLMGQLKPVQNWNPEILTTKLRESRWFL